MFKMQARDRVDGGGYEGAAANSRVPVKYQKSSSQPLPSPSPPSPSPPPPAPAAPAPPQRSSASEYVVRQKIQTVKNGTQSNKNAGRVRIGNVSSQFNPAAMATKQPFGSLEFQSVEDGGTQNNENTGDIEIGNWG